MKWSARTIKNVVLRGRRVGQTATPWSRWIPDTPTVEPERFQATDEPYPGHWRFPPEPWPEDPAEGAARRERLNRTLGDLPVTWRAVVVARDVQGLSADEVATELGITPEDQVPLLHRARAALREDLAEHYEQGSSGTVGPEDTP
ncbi:MAG: RNA polymerase sigma factor [Acidimicrobiia bacterium]